MSLAPGTRWSPSGEWIAYNPGPRLALVSPDGKQHRDLELRSASAVLWSRDGKTLYAVATNAQDPNRADLVIMDVASGKVVPEVLAWFPVQISRRCPVCLR